MWNLITILVLLIAALLISINSGPTLGVIDVPQLRQLEPRRSFSNDVAGYSADHRKMRKLIRGIDNHRIFVQKNGQWADTCLWANVFCNEEMHVTRISWSRLFSPVKLGGGTIDLSFMPCYVVHFDIGHTRLVGSLNTIALPRFLREMYINYCHFHGTIDWVNLPQTLEILNVGNNHFKGEVSLSDMPAQLFQLNISKNTFSSVTGDLSNNTSLKRNRIIGIADIQHHSLSSE